MSNPPDRRDESSGQRPRRDRHVSEPVYETTDETVEAPAPGSEALTATPPPDSAPMTPGKQIGRYRLLQRIGEGGMGEVWEAEQLEPVKRRVALKVIKRGMDTQRVVARFEAERQALAMMNHANVARVFDAGETPRGRPYFVMEYVKGDRITSYCDRNRLSTQQRLELMRQVCDGVQHAHQKGIIHRDLKPSNILVTLEGSSEPTPKIIDFGVAKATHHQLTEATLFTELGQMIGTPEYMSPEQAEMTGVDVDTRTDVYSLGVVLYELLTGALPFGSRELREAGLAEIQRRIREDDPPRPSTRVSSLGKESVDVAQHRRTETPELVRRLRGDLDWITMKALEKDRSRRYASPADLAADLERHLRDEPVEAASPSLAYRSRKFVRRHKIGVAAGVAVLAMLLLGIAGTTSGLVRAKRAESDAVVGAATEPPPANAAKTSTRPWRAITSSTMASACAGSARSAGIADAAPPAAAMAATVSSSSSARRAVTTTCAPSPANDSATARPMFHPPPVTIATWPARRCDGSLTPASPTRAGAGGSWRGG